MDITPFAFQMIGSVRLLRAMRHSLRRLRLLPIRLRVLSPNSLMQNEPPNKSLQPVISSARLDLVPMSIDFLRASLDRDLAAASAILQASIPNDWSTFPQYVLALRLKQLEAMPALGPWLLRAMVLRSSRAMIGDIGFHGPPGNACMEAFSPGAAEFGFDVFPAFRRQGYAHEASIAMIEWASRAHGVRNFIFTIRPDNIASQALAAKLGFSRIGSHEDEVDGTEDILEYKAAP